MSDIPPGKVPVLASASVALNYLLENWMRWLPACGVLGLLTGYLQMASVQMVAGTQGAGPQISSGYLLSNALMLLFTVVFMAALYKHVIKGEYTAPVGLSFGIEELRLLGVQLSLGLLMGIVAFFFMLIFMVMFVSLAAQMGLDIESVAGDPAALGAMFTSVFATGGGFILLVILIIATVMAMFAWVRLSLVQAATIGEGKMMIFSTWEWTKGNFWRVLAAMLVLVLPWYLIASLVTGVLQMALLGGSVANPFEAPPASMFVIGAVAGVLNGVLYIAIAGLLGHLYKGLRPDQPSVKVFE